VTTIAEALDAARIDGADARALLRRVLGVDQAWLVAHPEQLLTQAQHARFRDWVERRRAGEPVAYLTGSREFYSLEFKVTPAVLIPRAETELLVELALERVEPARPLRVLDLGTGSGSIAVAIARERPAAQLTAVDASREALAVARENAQRHGARVEFVEGSWFSALGGCRFDVIVANPPYIAEDDPHLAQGDLRFEPRVALAAGAQGLDAIEAIVEQAPRHLVPGGWLLFEHGYNQGSCSRVLLEAAGYADVFTRRDLAGLDRVSGGRV